MRWAWFVVQRALSMQSCFGLLISLQCFDTSLNQVHLLYREKSDAVFPDTSLRIFLEHVRLGRRKQRSGNKLRLDLHTNATRCDAGCRASNAEHGRSWSDAKELAASYPTATSSAIPSKLLVTIALTAIAAIVFSRLVIFSHKYGR